MLQREFDRVVDVSPVFSRVVANPFVGSIVLVVADAQVTRTPPRFSGLVDRPTNIPDLCHDQARNVLAYNLNRALGDGGGGVSVVGGGVGERGWNVVGRIKEREWAWMTWCDGARARCATCS